jgi:hypothetical protein
MKTLLDIDKNVLIDYQDFDKVNENWHIGSYLNMNYDLNAAVAFSKLFFPDFIEIEGCIILAIRYDKEVFKQWQKELKGNTSEVEKMCNLYELKDFFHINIKDDQNENYYEKALDYLGMSLKNSWDINLSKLYPDRKFKVEVFEEYDSKFITLFTV